MLKNNIIKKTMTLIILVLSVMFFTTVADAAGCYYDSNTGAPGCFGVPDWGVSRSEIFDMVENVAKNNPGTQYMAWCPTQGAQPEVRQIKSACNCPGLNPAPGQCISASCNACQNPTVKCAPPPKCVDECSKGDTMCSKDDLLTCGNFDSDECLEWGFKQDCDYKKEGEVYYQCEYEDSVGYRNVEKGYCKDVLGNNDYCTSYSYKKRVSETDCGSTQCEGEEYCYNDDIYSNNECLVKGCKESTGMCFSKTTNEITKVEDCGIDSKSDEYCNGEAIVYEETLRGCEERGNDAFCIEDSNIVEVNDCGSDTCEEFTDMGVFIKEYVHDEESCVENEYAYCAYDPGDIFDYCLNTDILMQALCIENDYGFEQFDCSTLSGCYEFTYESCETCYDSYDQRCEGTWCNMTGMKWVDYNCGDGECSSQESDMIDLDSDNIDDRCDDCIDVDGDGACDDVDNCVGVFNPTQVDRDNDGMGNACDVDRDNDGYNSNVDCDDWNPEVNPGAKEIPNNNRDDDCNENTADKGTYTPKQALFIDTIYDESSIVKGEDMLVLVSVTNNFKESFEDLRVSVSLPGFSQREVKLIRNLKFEESHTEQFRINVPYDLQTEFEFLRISVSNDYYKRIIYREIKFPV